MEELQPSLTTVAIADMMSELEQIVKQNKLQAANNLELTHTSDQTRVSLTK